MVHDPREVLDCIMEFHNVVGGNLIVAVKRALVIPYRRQARQSRISANQEQCPQKIVFVVPKRFRMLSDFQSIAFSAYSC